MSSTQRRASGSGAIKPAYLIAGSDEGKIDAALSRLRARAEREGGPGALESFAPERRAGAARRRRADRGDPVDVADGVSALPARRRRRAVDAPSRRSPWSPRSAPCRPTSRWSWSPARSPKTGARRARQGGRGRRRRGATLPGAEGARAAAPGSSPRRASAASGSSPMPRAFWSSAWGRARCGLPTSSSGWRSGRGRRGRSTVADLEAMVADTSEEAAWTLSDAIVARDPRTAHRAPRTAWPPRARASPRSSIRPRDGLREAHARAAASWRPGARRERSSPGSRCIPTRRRCWFGGCGELRRRIFAPPPARSPIWSGGPVAARSTRTTWR